MVRTTSWIAKILNVVIWILENFLSSSSFRFQDGFAQDDGAHFRDDSGSNLVQPALDYFEIKDSNDTVALREAVKKKFRKLSLVHHPDRNGNSEESVKAMQKVNNYYNILIDELDRREGVVHEEDEEGLHESEQQEERPEPTPEPAPKKSKKKKREKRRRQSARKPSKAAKKREAERRRHEEQAEKEQEEEWREIERQQKKVDASKHKMKHKIRKTVQKNHLDTAAGRDQANQRFQEEMRRFRPAETAAARDTASSNENGQPSTASMHDIDEDEVPKEEEAVNSEAGVIPEAGTKEKPVNLVMECCMDDVAVALRMQLEDAAMAAIQGEVTYRLLTSMYKNQRMTPKESDFMSAIANYLLEPLDEDGNSVLHYAVYYESLDVVGMIYHFACEAGVLSEVFLKKNNYGYIPLDFCQCCVKHTSLPDRMKTLTDAARAAEPSLQNTKHRLVNALRGLDWVSVVNLVASVWIGVGMFHTRLLTALVIAVLHLGLVSASRPSTPPRRRVGSLFSWHFGWWELRYLLFASPRWLFYSVLALFVLFACCGEFYLIFAALSFMPTALVSLLDFMMSLIPVPSQVKKLRLGDLQFYILLSIGMVALRKLASWKVEEQVVQDEAPALEPILNLTEDEF